VIVDPRLPEVDGGIAFISRLRATAPDVRILAMSWSDALEHAAVTGGADGFVRKTFRPTELVAAIVAAGRRPAA
jgi:DNA-binding response OmpR family regulator